MLLRHAIGATLRRIRLDRSLTLRVVADDARISMPYLSEIERGRKEASSEILAVICRALDMTVLDLLREVTAEANVVDLTTARAERTEVAPAADAPLTPVALHAA
jgi:transcriptional regulator with XRE-family HTH domain